MWSKPKDWGVPGHWSRCLFAAEVLEEGGGVSKEQAAALGLTPPERAAEPILKVVDTKTYYPVASQRLIGGQKRFVKAVDDVSFYIKRGETVGLVGESGCGKSTVAPGVMQDLGVNGRIVGGSIKFKGEEMNTMSPERLRDLRGNQIAMIYQEPMASLNPAMKIGRQLMEVPMIHEGVSEKEAYARALEVVTDVKLPDPERMLRSYPHQLSGGMAQRVAIARALLKNPPILIFDEATSSLDTATEQAIQETLAEVAANHTTLVIAHRLSTLTEMDRIIVMDRGRVVEHGSHDALLSQGGLYAQYWERQSGGFIHAEAADAAE